MKINERMKKVLSILLCVLMLTQYMPTYAFAATTAEDGLCEHHPVHTDECQDAEGSTGSECTHKHSEDCYAILECLHTCTADCADPCAHTHVVKAEDANGCYKLSTLTVKDSTGKSYPLGTDNNSTYSFTMPAANVTVTATFVSTSSSTADSTNPKTGDAFRLELWSGAMLMSSLCLALLLAETRKKRAKT